MISHGRAGKNQDDSHGNSQEREFLSLSDRYREIFLFLVVSEPVSEKFGTRKKSRNRYRSNLVSEKCLGTGIEKIWYRKKYRYRYRKYLVPEKSIGIGIVQHFGYRHTLVRGDGEGERK